MFKMAELPVSFFTLPQNHSDLVITSDVIHGLLESKLGPLTAFQTVWHLFISTAQHIGSISAPYLAPIDEAAAPLQAFTFDLAKQVGQDPATLRYLLVLAACYPLAIIFSLLRVPFLKHIFSLVVGVLGALFVFGSDIAHPVVASVVAYILYIICAPLRSARSPLAGLIPFVFMMGYMTALHLYRLHTDYMGWSLDITGPFMLLTMKLSSLGYQLADGSKKNLASYEKKVAEFEGAGKKAAANIFKDRISRAVKSVPNPLEYFAFVFCFTSFFAGPAFDFSEYIKSVNEETLTAEKKGLQWGRRLQVSLVKFAVAILCLAATGAGQVYFPFNTTFSYKVLHGSDTSVFYRYGWAWLCLMFTRAKYYFAWMITEGSANLAGFGYKGNKDWSGVQNIDIPGFEFAPTITDATKAWNQQTQQWLARYCSQRVDRSISMWATYALSAFWHGFYPGYYMAFLSAPLFANVEKALGEKIAPRAQAAGLGGVYSIVARISVSIFINYMIIPFVALAWDYGITVWASVYYFGHIACILAYIVLMFVPRFKSESKGETKKKQQ